MDTSRATISPEQDTATGTFPSDRAGDSELPVFSIGQLAEEFGLTLRALRFYEDIGLIAPQRDGAARRYAQGDHDRIGLILQGKKLGFTLREIRDLLASPLDNADRSSLHLSREQCIEQINLLERQKRMIENALMELRRTYSSHYMRELADNMPER